MSDTSNSYPTSLNGFTDARATGYLITAANWNALVASVNALEARVGYEAAGGSATADMALLGTGAAASDWTKITNAYIDNSAAIAASKIAVGVFGGSGMTTFPSGAYFGDTSNANMTIGLTINQGANDNEIIALKSSNVAHGVTSIAETDTYARFQKQDANSGGLTINGFSEVWGGVAIGGVATTEDNGRSTAAVAPFVVDASLKSGTSFTSMSADRNIAVLRNNGTARFIFDSDGDSHQDVGTAWTNFDDRDDVAALNLLAAHVSRPDDPLRANFGDWLAENRAPLEEAKLVTFNDDGHHFVNMSRLAMLLVGAVRQVGARLEQAEQRLTLLGAA